MCFNLRAGKGRTGVPRAATPHIPAGKCRPQVPCAAGRTNAAPPAQEHFPGWWRVFAPCSGGVGPAPSRAALCSGCCPSASIPHTASPFRRFPTKARDAVFRGGPICPGKSTGEALEPVPGRTLHIPQGSAGRKFLVRPASGVPAPERNGTNTLPATLHLPAGKCRLHIPCAACNPPGTRAFPGRQNKLPPRPALC